MSRIAALFTKKPKRVLNIYCTAGYPTKNSLMGILRSLQENGVDMVEIGMPYSDPLADGPVIQASSGIAIENGMTIELLFDQLKELRKQINIPVILMGYMNPVLQYGFKKFCADAASVGIDGLILPDLPGFEYENEYASVMREHGLDMIFLVTPETSEERVRKLDKLSSGFLYAVSSSSTTGSDKDMKPVSEYLRRLADMKLTNPVMVGFGIRDKASFDQACLYANGAIIGSAFVKALENSRDEANSVKKFIGSITG